MSTMKCLKSPVSEKRERRAAADIGFMYLNLADSRSTNTWSGYRSQDTRVCISYSMVKYENKACISRALLLTVPWAIWRLSNSYSLLTKSLRRKICIGLLLSLIHMIASKLMWSKRRSRICHGSRK